jgi:hypothetical protein
MMRGMYLPSHEGDENDFLEVDCDVRIEQGGMVRKVKNTCVSYSTEGKVKRMSTKDSVLTKVLEQAVMYQQI